MATRIDHDLPSLAKSLRPGTVALIAAELDKLIDEAVVDFRAKMVERIKHTVDINIERALVDSKLDIRVDCRVTTGGEDEIRAR